MHKSSVYDANLIHLQKIRTASGSITAVHNGIEIPFDIKRCFYLFDVPSGQSRGGHAHKELHQLIISASGSFEVLLSDANNQRAISLNQPNEGVYVPPGLWSELANFSSGSICLVLASEYFDEADYIRSYHAFSSYKKNQQ